LSFANQFSQQWHRLWMLVLKWIHRSESKDINSASSASEQCDASTRCRWLLVANEIRFTAKWRSSEL
jgi:hypothetical protein